jgi:hypothetical protein
LRSLILERNSSRSRPQYPQVSRASAGLDG